MFDVNDRIHIPDEEFSWTFVRSGGPGGQNVNKVASKAVLRWDIVHSPSLDEGIKLRFRTLYRSRITTEGELVLPSQRYRDQDRNKQDCLEKLREMILGAATVQRARRPTKATRGSKERRLDAKHRRSDVKRERRRPISD